MFLDCRARRFAALGGAPRGQPRPPVLAARGRNYQSLTWVLGVRYAELTYTGRCLSLCLYGESRTGKTLWARSLGKHIYCVGLVSGNECLKDDVDYAVFDDIRGNQVFPSFKEWLGAQAWVTVKCLYREPKLKSGVSLQFG